MSSFMNRVEDIARKKLDSDQRLQYMPPETVQRELQQELDRLLIAWELLSYQKPENFLCKISYRRTRRFGRAYALRPVIYGWHSGICSKDPSGR
jgi:hypothetical protein